MSTAFSEALSKLRQSRGVSQRTAAADLGVSQALLSHYENGIREPGLDFVKRACDYYEVSSDYMLGRSAIKKEIGGVPLRTEANSAEFEVSELAETDRRLISDSISVLAALLAENGKRQLMNDALAYISLSILRLFAAIDGKSAGEISGLTTSDMGLRCDAAIRLAEIGLREGLEKCEKADMSALDERFPETYNSLLQVLYNAGVRIKRL